MSRRLGFLFCAFLISGSCTQSARPLTIRFDSRGARTPGSASAMDCYFVSLSADKISASTKAPLCAGLGKVSPLMTLSEIQSGASFKVPVAAKLKVKVFGVDGPRGCGSFADVEALFTATTRPEVYELGSTETSFQEGGSLTVASAYDPATAVDLAECDSSPGPGPSGSLEISAISPTQGLHRGGLEVTITGEGFNANTRVEIAGRNCAKVTLLDSEHLTCETPETNPGVWSVQVLDGTTVMDELPASFSAFQTVYAAFMDGSGINLRAYRQELTTPNTGKLTDISPNPLLVSSDLIPNKMILHPTGKWLVVSHRSASAANDAISIWKINLATGELQSRLEVNFAPNQNPYDMAFDRTGRYLFTSARGTGTLLHSCDFFDVENTNTCSVAGSVSWGFIPRDLGASPTGDFVYAWKTGPPASLFQSVISSGSPTRPPSSIASGPAVSDAVLFNPIKPAIFFYNSNPEFEVYGIEGDGTLSSKSYIFSASPGSLRDHAFPRAADSVYLLYDLGAGAQKIRRYPLDGQGFPSPASPGDADYGTGLEDARVVAVDEQSTYLFVGSSSPSDGTTAARAIAVFSTSGGIPGPTALDAVNINTPSNLTFADLVVN